MYQVDLTKINQTDTTKTRTVVITNKSGIQGNAGKDGITPHIDEDTGHWFFDDVDTGISATGLTKKDISLIHFYESVIDFPTIGETKDIYVAEDTSLMYRWNLFSCSYKILKPNYFSELEQTVSKLQTFLQKNVLTKPTKIIPGSLLVIDSFGNSKCTEVSYKDLMSKVDSSYTITNRIPNNLPPQKVIIGANNGSITSSDISEQDLLTSIKNSKEAIKLFGSATKNTIALINDEGSIKSSGKTFSELIDDIHKSSTQADWEESDTTSTAFIKNKPDVVTIDDYIKLSDVVDTKISISGNITPGVLMIADESGNIKCSNIKQDDILKKSELIYGSRSSSVNIKEDKTHIITIPQEVVKYDALNVYHNGSILVEETHYLRNNDTIIFNGFDAYKNDIVTFVGYGSVQSVNGSGSNNVTNLVGSKSEYVLIDVDETNTITIPDFVKNYPAINVYHNGILLIEGVHYSINDEFIKLNGFVSYKNDIFNFVGYGSASLIPDGQGTKHTHQNKLILDTITQEKINAWDTITNHNHDDLYLKKNESISPALLPIGNEITAGVVKSSTGVNKITILEDGTMTIDKIDVNSLISNDESGSENEDFSLILSSGSATSYKD